MTTSRPLTLFLVFAFGLLCAPAWGQDAAKGAPSWRWLVIEHGVDLSYSAGWDLARLPAQGVDALVRANAVGSFDFVQVLSADAGPLKSVSELAERMRAGGAKVALGKRGRHETLTVRGEFEDQGRRMVRHALVAVIEGRLVEVRATFSPNKKIASDVARTIESVRFKKPLPAWTSTILSSQWMVRFPAAAEKSSSGTFFYSKGDLVLSAQLLPHKAPLKDPQKAFKLLAEELKILKQILETAAFTIEEESRLPTTIFPQAIGLRFKTSREGKAKLILTLSSVTEEGVIRLMAVVDPSDREGLSAARIFLHQLRLIVAKG
jgi:hypothetical protein